MKSLLLTIAICAGFSSLLSAQEIESIPTDAAARFGGLLSDLAGKIANPQVVIAADVAKANGVHVPEEMVGILVVPQKDLKESEELDAKFKSDAGAAIGYLFLYHVTPVVDGKRVAADQLRDVTLTDDEGAKITVHVLLLAVRQVADGDYRLYAYGKDKKPVVDAKFSEAGGGGSEPVGVSVKDVDEQAHQGTVVITVFGKYQASFRGGHTEAD